MRRHRILYVQFTNPAAYPPLEHSSRILADREWEVLFLGTGAFGVDALRFPPHPRIEVRLLPFQDGGWRQKLQYARFALWVLLWVARWRPQWIYCSDPLSCPIGFLLSLLPGLRTVYHEHDSPEHGLGGPFAQALGGFRRAFAQRAELRILPNEQRVKKFLRALGNGRPTHCVWNCPRLEEAVERSRELPEQNFWLYYHGSIGPERLPMTILEAMVMMPEQVCLRVLGYETVGSSGYLDRVRHRARQLGIEERVVIQGAAVTRAEVLQQARRCDVGLVLMPVRPRDVNMAAMVGASNKAFDYLACGMPVLTSDLPEWQSTFVAAGCGLGCNPDEPGSISSAIQWLFEHRDEARRMGARGYNRVIQEWHYQRQFGPVLEALNGGNRSRSGVAEGALDRECVRGSVPEGPASTLPSL